MLKAPNCQSLDNFNQISKKTFDSNDIKSQKENENLKEMKSIFDFISSKNKIIFTLCFDKEVQRNFYMIKKRHWPN
jgi:hypothetical protein